MSQEAAYSIGFVFCVLILLGIRLFVNPSKINRRLDDLEWKLSELEDRVNDAEADRDWDVHEDWDETFEEPDSPREPNGQGKGTVTKGVQPAGTERNIEPPTEPANLSRLERIGWGLFLGMGSMFSLWVAREAWGGFAFIRESPPTSPVLAGAWRLLDLVPDRLWAVVMGFIGVFGIAMAVMFVFAPGDWFHGDRQE